MAAALEIRPGLCSVSKMGAGCRYTSTARAGIPKTPPRGGWSWDRQKGQENSPGYRRVEQDGYRSGRQANSTAHPKEVSGRGCTVIAALGSPEVFPGEGPASGSQGGPKNLPGQSPGGARWPPLQRLDRSRGLS